MPIRSVTAPGWIIIRPAATLTRRSTMFSFWSIKADQADGDEEHTAEGGDDHADHVDRVHIIANEQHDGAVRKDIGNDVRRR